MANENAGSFNIGGTGSMNPYSSRSDAGYSDDASGRNQQGPFPTLITVIAIIFLVFGVLGSFQVILGIFSTLFFSNMFSNSLQGREKDMNDALQAMMREKWIVVYGILTLNGILSIAMIVAGIGLLKRKLSGARIGVAVALFSILYKIMETGWNSYSQLKAASVMGGNMPANANVDPAMMQGIMVGALVFGIVFMVLPLIAFYGWTAYYLSRSTTRAHLS